MSISLLIKLEYLQAASTVCYVHVAILYSDVVGRILRFTVSNNFHGIFVKNYDTV